MKYVFVAAGVIIVVALACALFFSRLGGLVPRVVEEPAIELADVEGSLALSVSEPQRLAKRSVHRLGWWFDAGPFLLSGDGASCGRVTGDQGAPDRLSLEYRVHDILDWREPSESMLALIAEMPAPCGQVAVCLDRQGAELWRYQPDTISLDIATPLWGADGLYGVAFGVGGDEGVLAKSLSGELLWQLPRQFVVHQLLTHPSLPGIMVKLKGEVEWIEHSAEFAEVEVKTQSDWAAMKALLEPYYFANLGVLFPDRQGDASVILAASFTDVGTGELFSMLGDQDEMQRLYEEAPTSYFLMRQDRGGNLIWRIQMPCRVLRMATLGGEGERVVVAVILSDGTLVFVGEDGAVFERTSILGLDLDEELFVFDFDAGPIEGGLFGVTANSSKGAFFWEVALPPAAVPQPTTK